MNALLQSKDLIGKMNGVIRKSKFTGNAIPRLRLPVGRESHPFLAGFSRNARRTCRASSGFFPCPARSFPRWHLADLCSFMEMHRRPCLIGSFPSAEPTRIFRFARPTTGLRRCADVVCPSDEERSFCSEPQLKF